MPEDSRKVAGGSGEKKERERQASTAVTEKTQPGAIGLLEEVLRRENMLSAFRRVRSNKGAPGIDGMTVEQLVTVNWHAVLGGATGSDTGQADCPLCPFGCAAGQTCQPTP